MKVKSLRLTPLTDRCVAGGVLDFVVKSSVNYSSCIKTQQNMPGAMVASLLTNISMQCKTLGS
jgi:hypothetical protein